MDNPEPSPPTQAPAASPSTAGEPSATVSHVRPRFSWRAFVIGAVVGVAAGVVGLVALIVGLAVFVSRAGTAALESPSALPAPDVPIRGELSAYGEVPATWTLRTLDAAPVPLRRYRGQVVFLNVWATWCAPCQMELPAIERLANRVKDDERIAVVLVSNEDADTIRTFLIARHSPLTSLRADAALPALLQTPGIPSKFVIDPDGLVVYRHVGMARWDADESVAFLRGLTRASGASAGPDLATPGS